MARLFATAGTKVHIGAVKAFDSVDFTATDFTTGTPVWTEIKGTTDLGSFGDTQQVITSNHVGEGRTRKIKGSKNAGSMTLVCDLDYADPGQIALIAAANSKDSYAFRITLNDAPTGGTPSERYFTAYVMSATEGLAGADSVQSITAALEIDSNIVRVAADEA